MSDGGKCAPCERCGGYARVIDGNWVVPHLTRGKRVRLCPGSSQRVPVASVMTLAELKTTKEGRGDE